MAILGKRDSTVTIRTLVIDTRSGWDIENIESEIIGQSWKRYLYDGKWLPVVIRDYANDGSPIYKPPILPVGMATPPEKLYRALIAWPPVVKRFCKSMSDIWGTLKKGALIGFLAAILVALILVWGSMTGG
ncbi:hypothetical protein [Dehalococcoides mccartyi]|uniref:hypothetical protein n=1 Tax=Dehalococcoides mccartyi TaxID=61435 RepID=UPI000870F9DE|nr:hypothetical protein [Dehalococcoides mccartyi]AOV99535.1 hypothetical protein DCWBC2_0903 [Dehalococcoides mccartyi]PKH45951.1 hypothetical protein KKB3_00770 [Dehalococcoides mccartyi]